MFETYSEPSDQLKIIYLRLVFYENFHLENPIYKK
eukprot:UN06793